MLRHIHIAGIGEGLFWFVVVIVTIIVQIIKASKRVSQSQSERPDQESAEGYTAPQDELQSFLESLTGVHRESPPRPAAPPPVPAFAQPVQAPPKREAPQMAAAPRDFKAPPAVRREARVRKDSVREFAASTATPVSAFMQETRRAVSKDLGDRDSLRKAIVLREILGPPLALRH